ncbi:dihydropteroate synthase [Patulibacter minatonensis]|uniref:dihydropteroate synthase n=1 Tax=Patulibacter minatonensis TaxID=298163 RepID=UPI0004B5E9C1|nr:dihydropteroate synthase [Patulibacter minatonensis]
MPAPYTLMGVLDLTPASPSEYGAPFDVDAAVARGVRMAGAGAAVIDVGAEATAAMDHDVPAAVEIRRIVPVVEGLVAERPGTVVSIDTTKAVIARAALAAGATHVNDISGLRSDPDMLPAVVEHGASCCLVHMRGTPRTMQGHTRYEDVVQDVRWFLERRVDVAVTAGVDPTRIAVDPGVGFSKTPEQDLEVLRRLREFTTIGCPVMVGTSRKGFVPHLTGRDDPAQHLGAAIATAVVALQHGATIFRVHDVAPVADALAMAAHLPWPTIAPRAADRMLELGVR